jgi:hypothetical protein
VIRPVDAQKILNFSLTIFRWLSGSSFPRDAMETDVPTDANLEMECDRVRRIVAGLNDELSRQLLGAYAADLRDAQQKQRLVERELDLLRSVGRSPARRRR